MKYLPYNTTVHIELRISGILMRPNRTSLLNHGTVHALAPCERSATYQDLWLHHPPKNAALTRYLILAI
jgi:hypothetical protein